ncbi:hypothetical protein D3C81_1713870 [compost metagenome]
MRGEAAEFTDQRFGSAESYRNLCFRPGQREQPQCVVRRLLDTDVAKHCSNPFHNNIRSAQRIQYGQCVIDTCIAVNDDSGFAHFCFSPILLYVYYAK